MASELMLRFAERTGLTSNEPQRRYLWTDAFAVTNFLGLARATGEQRYADLALRLVAAVHHTLGRHREDDSRKGWISGLAEKEGELHPTRGGLRIGKALPQRKPQEAFDERLEWDRDGQYFHYLTKWMHALDQVARFTKRPVFNDWARELAARADSAFTQPGNPSRMYWKMSIDLSRPLVASMGQHDPLDGYVTCAELQATAARFGDKALGPDVSRAARRYAAMLEGRDLETSDPLGLGGLLTDAYRVQQLVEHGALRDAGLLDRLLGAALSGLEEYARQGELGEPATQRLAFRELGLSIGLYAVSRMHGHEQQLRAFSRYADLAHRIESFWLAPEHQRVGTWTEHRDINEVMLATSLAPDGFLDLAGA